MNPIIFLLLFVVAFVVGIAASKRILEAVHGAEASIHLRLSKLEKQIKDKL